MKIRILTAAILFSVAVVASAQQGGGRGGDPVQRAEQQSAMMADSLSLSTKQAEKVKTINLKYANKSKDARSNNADGDWEKMRASMEAIRTEQNAELKTVLTQEQFDRWQTIAAQQNQRRGPGGEGRGSNNGEKAPKDKKEKGRKDKSTLAPSPPPPPAPENKGSNG